MGSWADGAILLTGATGLVGGELLPRLLAAAPASPVYCLLRARDDSELARRTQALLAAASVPARAAERVRAVAGDVRAADLGLGAARAELEREVRSVVHAAASTRFDQELEEARRSNVAGTRNVLAFARAARARLHHVSTAYVAGDRAGVFGAGWEGGARPPFHNSYEESKWEAEQLVREAAIDLHTTVYRPSIIVGDSRSGRTRHFRVLYDPFKWVIYGKTSLLPCRPEVRVDVVPVDFVCDALVALGARADAPGASWLLSAGPERALSIGEILALAEPIVNGWLSARGQPAVALPRIVSPDSATPELAELFALGAAVMRTHVPYMLRELLFDPRETERALAGTPVRCPPLRDILRVLLEFALERRFGTA